MSIKRVLPAAALILLAVLLPNASKAEPLGDASQFMMTLGGKVIALVGDSATPAAERKAQLRQIADSSFDVPEIAQFVLGRYWKTASDDDRTRYVAAFDRYMVDVYWSHFTSYHGESFRVTGQQDEGNGTILVDSEIVPTDHSAPPVKVTWSLVRSGGSFKVRDAGLEGVSQAVTYRDEFGSILERDNGQVSRLTAELTAKDKG